MIVDEAGVGVTQREARALVGVRPQIRPGGLVLTAAGQPDLDVPEPWAGEELGARIFRHREPVPVRAADDVADKWLSDLLDRPVRLVWLHDPTANHTPNPALRRPGDSVSLADSYPVLLTSTASLAALNDALAGSGSPEGPLPMTRFRPNLVVAGAPRWAEDGWIDRRLRIGPVTFRVVTYCDRCVVTTVDQETGESGREPLRVLAAHRRVNQDLLFGVYLVPEHPADAVLSTPAPFDPPPDVMSAGSTFLGPVRVGDPVELFS